MYVGDEWEETRKLGKLAIDHKSMRRMIISGWHIWQSYYAQQILRIMFTVRALLCCAAVSYVYILRISIWKNSLVTGQSHGGSNANEAILTNMCKFIC